MNAYESHFQGEASNLGQDGWPGNQSFAQFASEINNNRATKIQGCLSDVEAHLLQKLPGILLDFPSSTDRELAIEDYSDQKSLDSLADETTKTVGDVVALALVSVGYPLAKIKTGNLDTFHKNLEIELDKARRLATRLESWRKTLARKHESLHDRVESIESRLDEVSRFRVEMIREQAGALRGATGGTVKLMLTISAAMSAALATLLSSSRGLGSEFAISVGVTFGLGLSSVLCGVAYVLHHRAVLNEELSDSANTDTEVPGPSSVASALAVSEKRPFPWIIGQGVLMVAQLVTFVVAITIYLANVVVPIPSGEGLGVLAPVIPMAIVSVTDISLERLGSGLSHVVPPGWPLQSRRLILIF